MRIWRIAATVLTCSLALSACGTSHGSTNSFAASANCKVSATNLDLAGCDLAGRDLQGLDLASDNLRRANLSGADLDGADVQGADVQGATLTGVLTNASTVCVNARYGPCSLPGLRSATASAASSG